LFGELYRHLGRGRSVGDALAAAQRARLRAGAPAHAWAGVVAIGDPSVALVDAPPPNGGRRWLVWLAAAVVVLGSAAVMMRIRRRATGRVNP
jgi:hypothetical protein